MKENIEQIEKPWDTNFLRGKVEIDDFTIDISFYAGAKSRNHEIEKLPYLVPFFERMKLELCKEFMSQAFESKIKKLNIPEGLTGPADEKLLKVIQFNNLSGQFVLLCKDPICNHILSLTFRDFTTGGGVGKDALPTKWGHVYGVADCYFAIVSPRITPHGLDYFDLSLDYKGFDVYDLDIEF